ncbi:hypothetical protein FRC11_002442 [Ceratobasidium sp. 423]|nr:hypothetical protein FRC11_002442 [Ceratobasidium sp. 423]
MSTSMTQKAYGVCSDRLKRRLGLVGEQDLEILVNCVMSPFPTVANFTKRMTDAFKDIAHQEIKVCLLRNTVTPANFRFIVQGTDKPYLTLLPMFNMANYRHQLILSCDFPESVLRRYRAERAKNPSAVFYLSTTKDVELESILAGSFNAMLEQGLPDRNQPQPSRRTTYFQVGNIRVLKNTPINSKYLDPTFSEHMYFYLYGTEEQRHIEHMLVSSKNVQLTSDQVEFDFQLPQAEGLVVCLDSVHENIIFPVLPPNTPSFFEAGKRLKVSVFQDPHAADAHGPGLTSPFLGATPIVSGTMTLGKMVYTDSVLLNGNPGFEGVVAGQTPEERLNATRQNYIPEDVEHVGPYYKHLNRQEAWSKYWDEKMSSIGYNSA